jgi:hypothetical protein
MRNTESNATPLHSAVKFFCPVEVVRMLVKAGPAGDYVTQNYCRDRQQTAYEFLFK